MIRNRYNQVPQDTNNKETSSQLDITNENLFPADDINKQMRTKA